MANKMLIDATHPEETRVVVLRGNRVEEFDFESASRRQLRGNIYLAKVTRVEPSLQAAFVDYGGNRHGFLAFSEIHPDYYQIPVADRQVLIDEEERAHRAAEAEADRRAAARAGGSRQIAAERPPHRDDRVASEPIPDSDGSTPDDQVAEAGGAPSPSAGEAQTELDFARSEADAGSITGAPEAGQPETAAPADISASDGAASDVATAETGAAAAPAETAAGETPVPAAIVTETSGTEAPADETAATESPAVETAAAPDAAPESAPAETAAASAEAPAEPAAAPIEGEILPPVAGPDGAPNGHDLDDDEDDEDDEDEDDDEEHGEEEEETIESVGGADALEELPDRTPRMRRQYKIQEVIKRRQVMLVQVVKEERGTKGAALTTYLSLAGRYSVLMPNTARGGGISRKITNAQDRKRLKEIAQELEVPEGMGVILRTAGAARTKTEVKRDFEYLLRVWEQVRDLTLRSTAATLVYEEGSVVKRAIRDLYNKDIDEVIVAGEAAYREAKDFMRMLMPSHAKNVKLYAEPQPLLTRYGVETQLDAMFSPTVQLRSGGYIVLNQTEALVAIDVNSGRATREHHIEDTALKTNLEACEEVARQLRLRDLAGLIVIDFIDMDEKRNNRAVERRLKECLKNDRARIQVGRISHFGLMEMSRQRIRTSVFESSTEKCPHCGGTGHVRSVSSVALQCLRMLEETLMRGATHNLAIRTGTDTALYILNHKRAHLAELESRFRLTITVKADPNVMGQHPFVIEKGEQVHSLEQARALAAQAAQAAAALPSPARIEDEDEDESEADSYGEIEVVEDDEDTEEQRAEQETGESDGDGRRRRRRRRRGRRGDEREERGERSDRDRSDRDRGERPVAARDTVAGRDTATTRETVAEHEVAFEDHDNGDEVERDASTGDAGPREAGDGDTDASGRRRRRRGRRGGRRNRRHDGSPAPFDTPEPGFDLLEPDIAEAIADFGGPRLDEAVTAEAPEGVGTTDPLPTAERPSVRDIEIRTHGVAEIAPTEIGPENLPSPGAGFDAPERPVERRSRGRRAAAEVPPPPDFGPIDPPEPLQALAPESIAESITPPAEATPPAEVTPRRAAARREAAGDGDVSEPAPRAEAQRVEPPQPEPVRPEPVRRRSTVREPVSFLLERGNEATSSVAGDNGSRPAATAGEPSTADSPATGSSEPAAAAETNGTTPPAAAGNTTPTESASATEAEAAKPRRTGWWARRLLGDKA
ncbi:Ribonuclease E [Rhodoplanes serenus]|uniref:Ribonuclease E n=1 Tax=Rhodoplanes serenus TaxID=200615 RepID=A0A447CWK5_9BRAD|nr:ribonuclease E/G [Rhodoplanes serenus]VCU09725.1 Ribonuclease E [Rhodoplanes serenus]